MDFTIHGVHYDLTNTTHQFIKDKVQKLKFAQNDIISLNFTITPETKEQWTISADIHLQWKKDMHFSKESRNLFEAIDNLIDTIAITLHKELKKVHDQKRHAKSIHELYENNEINIE